MGIIKEKYLGFYLSRLFWAIDKFDIEKNIPNLQN